MHWIHRSTSLVAGTVLLVIAWSGSDHLGFDPAPYLSDLQALEDSTARSYANLEWQVQQGVVDPVALHRRTDSLIRAASSASDAQAALIAFGSAMKDGHYRLRRPQTSAMKWMMTRISGERESAPFVAMGGAKGCASLGYRDLRTSSPLRSHSAYHAVGRPDASFPTGFVDYNGQRVGVLRIASFGNDGYRTVCARAWPVASRADSSGVCAARCQRLLEDATSDSLLAELRHAIARLTSLGVTTLLVDLTGNGGGTNWVTPAARQFTARRLNGHVAGEIRHPHTERRLVTAVSALRTALANSADSSWRESLALAVARANAQLAAVRAPCDRRAIWREGLASIRCSQLATHAYTTGFLEYLPPGAHGLPSAGVAFGPARYHYDEGTWSGPLVLLVDRHTASASEDFMVALKDQGAARVIGERTYGAGCGYTDGGIGFVLAHSELLVTMPDCARIRLNGKNEVSGIEVDLEVKRDATLILDAVTLIVRGRLAPSAPDP